MNVMDVINASITMDIDRLKKETNRLEKTHGQDPQLYGLLFIVGTILYTKNNNTPNDEILYFLQESVRLRPMRANLYQLAYILEQLVRASRATNNNECKQMIELYIQCKQEEAKAACQLGSYLIDFPKDNDNKDPDYVEKLLLSAHYRKIPQAIVHLIRLYKRQKAFPKVVEAMKIKYLQRHDMMDLMELSLLLLNSADYFLYCKTMKECGQPITSVKMFLKPGSFDLCIEEQECCVCLTELNNTRKLVCKHYVCDECLLQMFENNIRTCPQCRLNLCPEQTDTMKTCVENMMMNDSIAPFTHSFTLDVKKQEK